MATWWLDATTSPELGLRPPMSGTGPTVPGPPVAKDVTPLAPEAPQWPWRPGGPAGPPPPRAPRSRSGRARLVGGLVAVAVVAGALGGWATHQANGYFLFSPGTAPLITASAACKDVGGQLSLPNGSPCVHLVVPQGRARAVAGGLYMVDVEVGQANALDWLTYQFGLLGSDRELVPVSEYAPGTPVSELGCQDTQQMVSADQDAAQAAFKVLGYRINESALGAQVVTVYPGTAAWDAGVKCNDLITALDGHPVRSSEALTRLLAPLSPGTVVHLTVSSGGRSRRVSVKLGPVTASARARGASGKAYMGVMVQTWAVPKLPFPVSVNAGPIGGPSAGLAFCLAILDALSNGKLTGGHRVAATGTIDPQGNVGDVGGVREKTVAVEKAGAQVFFVPRDEYGDARSQARGGLAVVPVTTLGQVLRILHQRYGGDISGLRLG